MLFRNGGSFFYRNYLQTISVNLLNRILNIEAMQAAKKKTITFIANFFFAIPPLNTFFRIESKPIELNKFIRRKNRIHPKTNNTDVCIATAIAIASATYISI